MKLELLKHCIGWDIKYRNDGIWASYFVMYDNPWMYDFFITNYYGFGFCFIFFTISCRALQFWKIPKFNTERFYSVLLRKFPESYQSLGISWVLVVMASGVRRHVTGSHDVVLLALFVSLRSLTFVVYTRSLTFPSFPPHVRYSSLDAPNKTYLIGSCDSNMDDIVCV